MTRDYFQDITPPNHSAGSSSNGTSSRSIRDIAPSGNRPRTSRPVMADTGGRVRPVRKRRNFMLWGIAAIALLLLGFLLTTVFLKTTITVTPRVHTVVFDSQTTYTAYAADDTKAPAGALLYTTDTQMFEDSISVAASGSEEVSVGASGTITIYNNYSETSQRLIPNTRFETPDGKIYRIQGAVVIPGKKGGTPGSITATVYADQPGAEYNIGPIERFSVPGLKGSSDMYANIYASSDKPMTGGFVGMRPSISEASEAAAKTQLESSIEAQIAAAYADTTDQYALVRLAKVSYSPLSVEVADDGSAVATLTAQVTAPVFSRAVLDAFLASETSATAGSAAIHILDPSTFSLVPAGERGVALGIDPIDFGIGGKAVFVWDLDTVSIAADLAGKNKATFQGVVKGYPAIDAAAAKVYPIWSQAFPDNPEDIKVVVLPVE